MTSEYFSKEAANNFAKIDLALPVNALTVMLEKLRQKNPQGQDEGHPEFDSMLDVGCGAGRTMNAFESRFKSIIGIDSSKEQIDQAKKLNPYKNVNYLMGSGENMPIADDSIDFVTFIFSPEYMDMKKVEMELNRVLKPKGLAVLYGDKVVGIDMVDKDSGSSIFPELVPTVISLWDNCFKVFKDHAFKIDHPEYHYFCQYENLCQGLNTLRQERVDDIKTDICMSLDAYLSIWVPGIPFFYNTAETLGRNPVEEFGNEAKRLWKIPDVDNKDVTVKITYSSYMIFLDKKA